MGKKWLTSENQTDIVLVNRLAHIHDTLLSKECPSFEAKFP